MCRAGELEEGMDRLAEVVRLSGGGRFVAFGVGWMSVLAKGYVLAGDYDRAMETAEEAVKLAERHWAKYSLG